MKVKNIIAVNYNLQEIYTDYAPVLFKICLRYSSSYAEAEDLLHDSFIRIFERLPQYKGKGSFEGWLKRIVVSVAINKLRTNRFTPDYHETFDDINEQEIEVDYENLSEERKLMLDAELSHEDVFKCLQELPVKARAVFNLYVFEKKKHKEIAEELEISSSTSKTQLKRARVLLHKQLMRYAEMKRKNIKKLSIFAFLLPGTRYSYVDKYVKGNIDKANVTPPPMDMTAIAGKSAAGVNTISTSVNIINSALSHIKAHLITYTSAFVLGTSAITFMLLPEAEVASEKQIETINLRMHPVLNPIDLDSFIQVPVDQFEKRPVKVNTPIPTKESVDTVTIYEHVRVVDSLK